jgi:hypothetical protein
VAGCCFEVAGCCCEVAGWCSIMIVVGVMC